MNYLLDFSGFQIKLNNCKNLNNYNIEVLGNIQLFMRKFLFYQLSEKISSKFNLKEKFKHSLNYQLENYCDLVLNHFFCRVNEECEKIFPFITFNENYCPVEILLSKTYKKNEAMKSIFSENEALPFPFSKIKLLKNNVPVQLSEKWSQNEFMNVSNLELFEHKKEIIWETIKTLL